MWQNEIKPKLTKTKLFNYRQAVTKLCWTDLQSIEEVSGNLSNERARLASTKADEINTAETVSAIKTPNLETSKKVTFKSKNGADNEKKEAFESKEEGNTEQEGHEVKQGQKASKSNSVKMKRKEWRN